jgi:hypothetical protein
LRIRHRIRRASLFSCIASFVHRFWLLLPALALVLLAAHFLRAASWPGVAGCGALLALLAVPRAWAARVQQVALALGALEWLHTFVVLVQMRLALGEPWLRLAFILGLVAALTAASALVFQSRPLRARFRLR